MAALGLAAGLMLRTCLARWFRALWALLSRKTPIPAFTVLWALEATTAASLLLTPTRSLIWAALPVSRPFRVRSAVTATGRKVLLSTLMVRLYRLWRATARLRAVWGVAVSGAPVRVSDLHEERVWCSVAG